MAFKGDLRNVHLADILQTLAQNQQEGVLTLTSGGDRRRLLFSDAGISLLDSRATSRRRLGEILGRSNLLSEEQLQEALREHSRTGRFLGEILVDNGYVDDEQLQRILQIQVEEELYELFRIMDGSFEFREESVDDYEGQVAPFHVDGVVLEAARRLDEWQIIGQTVPDLNRVYILDEEADTRRFDDEETVVSECLDGKHTVQNAADALLSSPFSVAKVLSRLIERGVIRETTPAERLAAAEASLGLGNSMQAVALLEGLRRESPDEEMLRAIAPLLTEAGAPEKGAEVRIQLAEAARRRGDPEEAWHQLKSARRDCPDSPEVIERLATIAQDQGEQEVESRLRRRLAELKAANGDLEGCADTLERVYELHPADREGRRLLIDASLRTRRKSRAIELLLLEADELRGEDQVPDLVTVYKRILVIDSRRSDIKKLLKKVRRTRAERTIRFAAWAAGVLLTLGVGFYGFSHWMENKAAEEQLAEATSLFHGGQHDAARSMVQGVLAQFTQREVVVDASSLLDRIDAAIHERTREERATLESVFDQQLQTIESQVTEGRYDLALTSLFSIVATNREAYLRDRAALRLKQTCRELEQHVARSVRLASSYREPTRDADVREAYTQMSLSFPVEGLTRIRQIRATLVNGLQQQKQPQEWMQTALAAIDAWEGAVERMQPEVMALRQRYEHLQALERLSDDYLQAEEALTAGEPEKAAALYRRLLTQYGEGELRGVLEEKIRRLEGAVSTCEEIERLLIDGKVDVAETLAEVAREDYEAIELSEVLELPVRVESFPTGAQVRVGGEVVGRCPLVLRVGATKTLDVELESDGFDPHRLVLEPATSVVARAVLAKRARRVVELDGAVEASPTWHEGACWVAMRDGDLRRIDVESGEVLSFPTNSISGSRHPPLPTPSGVLHSTVEGSVYLVEYSGGALREVWSKRLGEELAGPPLLWTDSVILAGRSGRLQPLGLADGAKRPRIPLEGASSIVAAPSLLGDLLLVPLGGGRIAALQLARRNRLYTLEIDGDLDGPVLVDDDRLVVINTQGRVMSFDPRSGERRGASVELGQTPIAPAVLHGELLEVTLGDSLARVDLDKARVIERWPVEEPSTSPCIIGDELWIGDRRGAVHGFTTAREGALFSSTIASRELVGAPIRHDDLIAVLSADGRLSILVR